MICLCMVEDDVGLLKSMSQLFAASDEFLVAGSFVTAEECLESGVLKETDVLIADIDLPGQSGIDLIAAARLAHPDLLAMAYTIYDEREVVLSALRAGALGYVVKGHSFAEIKDSIHELVGGGSPMSPQIARKVLREFNSAGAGQQWDITSREQQVIHRIAAGCSYKEIAAEFSISPRTVHTHINKIYKKLQAASRQEALSRARTLGIIANLAE